MWEPVLEFLRDHVLDAGLAAGLLLLIGFMFKETWKQWIAKLSAEELASINAKFQQQVEAYKVSLIAQAEHAKAVTGLRKEIAIRHSLAEYERLLELHRCLGAVASILSRGRYPPETRTVDHLKATLADIEALGEAVSRAKLFLDGALTMRLLQLGQDLYSYGSDHIGPDRPIAEEAQYGPLLRGVAQFIIEIEPIIHRLGRLDDAA